MRITIRLLLAILLLAHAGGHAAAGARESGTMIKADQLKAEPYSDARTLANLAVGDKVDIVKKDAGWLNVKSAKGSGWVRMLSVRRSGVASKSSAGASGLTGLASGRAGTGKVVASTGIRGLNEEELKVAKFDEVEIKLAESYSTSRDEAQKFANEAKLTAQNIGYLPEKNAPGNNTEVSK